MERLREIYKALLKKGKEARQKNKYQFDLNMKNGEEITIYLEGEPIVYGCFSNDYSLLTDDNRVIHFDCLYDIACYLDSNY